MEKWIILQHPVLLLIYGMALLFCLFDRIYASTKAILTFMSAVLVIIATAFLLLSGAQLYEAAMVLLAFLLLNMEVKE